MAPRSKTPIRPQTLTHILISYLLYFKSKPCILNIHIHKIEVTHTAGREYQTSKSAKVYLKIFVMCRTSWIFISIKLRQRIKISNTEPIPASSGLTSVERITSQYSLPACLPNTCTDCLRDIDQTKFPVVTTQLSNLANNIIATT